MKRTILLILPARERRLRGAPVCRLRPPVRALELRPLVQLLVREGDRPAGHQRQRYGRCGLPAQTRRGRQRKSALPECDRRRLLLPVEVIVAEVNRFVRGWAAYFRFGNSARHFDKIRGYLRMRLALFLAKRHRRSRAFGWSVVAYASPNQLGLISLDGIVAAGAHRHQRAGLPGRKDKRIFAICLAGY